MTQSGCPYLTCDKTVYRGSLDLTAPAQASVVVTWYCEHPFHGLRLELGDARRDVEKHCAACSLPRRQPDADAD